MRFAAGSTRVLLAAMALVSLVSTCGPAFCDVDDRPILVVREDDCRATWRVPYAGLGGVSALDYGKQKHIPVTWGIISDRATTGHYGYSLFWWELLDYLTVAGGEAASHSKTHVGLSSDAAYIDELAASKAAIEANLPGYTCTTFLQPGPWSDANYVDDYAKLSNPVSLAVQSTYQRSQAYLGSGWTVGPVFQEYGLAPNCFLDFPSCSSVPAMLTTLDTAASIPGLVFVITCHGVQETGGTNTYEVRADVMKALMDKLADLRDSGKVRLMGMRDAYTASKSFSPNLNHVPDPGFELLNPSSPSLSSPWQTQGAIQILPSGGVGDSRYASLRNGTDQLKCKVLGLAPGRYEMSWYQKPEAGYPTDKALWVWIESDGRGTGTYDPSYANYGTADPSVWERKSALFVVQNQRPWVYLYFLPKSGAGYGVDSVSITSAPLDPAVSPVITAAAVTPTALTLRWLTPPSADGSTVCIRYSFATTPLAPTAGLAFGQVPAVEGTTQSLSASFAWSSTSHLYVSVFCVAADGSYSPPDVFGLAVDSAVPTTPVLSHTLDGSGAICAKWSSSDPHLQSGVYGYQYAVGTGPGMDDVVSSTFTTQAGATIPVAPGAPTALFLTVRSQNLYGYWSSPAVREIALPRGMAQALLSADGSLIAVSGVVSAVFSDCVYVQEPSRTRGVKVVGLTGCSEGAQVAVTGVISTDNGERLITVGAR